MTVVVPTFLQAYMPAIVLVLIGAWHVILVLSERYRTEAGRLFGLAAAFVFFGLAMWLLSVPFSVIPLDGELAFRLYAGGLLVVIGAGVRRRVGFVLYVLGALLLFLTYLSIVPAVF